MSDIAVCVEKVLSDPVVTSEEVVLELSVSDDYMVLWQQAIQEYRQVAKLSKDENWLLSQNISPDQIFILTKNGWNTRMAKSRDRYESIKTTVTQVLALIEIITPTLGITVFVPV